jgi:hypothetical protein
MTDGRIGTLNKADLTDVDAAQQRYQHIATTIDDAVAKLQKIVDADSDGLRGQYVAPLQKDAAAIKDSLSKAAVRYNDVASEIKKYEPELGQAKDDVKAALAAGEDADASLSQAKSMPDPQKASDGTLPPEEQQKDTAKKGALDEAGASVTAAKNRLTAALDALDVAGKRLGDAVNAKNYDDGLSDTLKDKVLAVLKVITKIFAVIAVILSVLAFLIPGAQAIAIAGVVAAGVLLVGDSVLYAYGEAKVSDVVLDALGLVLPGVAAGFGKLAKSMDEVTKGIGALKIKPGGALGLGSKPPLIPKPGFFDAPWTGWKGLGTNYVNTLLDMNSFTSITALTPGAGSSLWKGWTGLNNAFSLGTGVGYAGFQVNDNGSLLAQPVLDLPKMNLPS